MVERLSWSPWGAMGCMVFIARVEATRNAHRPPALRSHEVAVTSWRNKMRNSILSAALIGAAIMGGIVGGNIRDMQINEEIHDAWSDVSVVKDGQLIANPAYYAFNPDELANAENVRIIDNRSAGLDQAFNRTPRLIGFGCKGLKTPAMGAEESDFPKCDAILPIEQLPNRG